MRTLKTHKQSFLVRLVIGACILVFATTLSAGAPAYWLARTQLERQAWRQVENAQQATRSLLDAERGRLRNLALLFAERPTLQRLVQEQDWAQVAPYLQAFQDQSDLDLLLFCDVAGSQRAGQPNFDRCPAPGTAGFALVQAQPALLMSAPVEDHNTNTQYGVAVTGRWLDEHFLQQIAGDTGVQQSILSLDGVRLSSSIAGATGTVAPAQNEAATIGGHHFFITSSTLSDSAGAAVLRVEVALLVDDLLATESRGLAILITSTGLTALAGVAAATWYIQRMTRPLWQLTRIAREIAQGNFVAPIPTFSGPLEVSTLAVALQHSHARMRQALDELAQARDWLNNLIQSIVEGVIIADNRGRITFLSQGAETLAGWRSEEAVGQSINDLFRLAEPGGATLLDAVSSPNQQHRVDVVVRNNRPLTLAVTSAQLTPLGRGKPHTALVLRDVTEEEAARHLRAYFLANITHEFRTPLSTLKASLELLLDEREALSPAEMRQLLKPTYLSLLSLQTLIDNLLESSKIEAGRFTIRRQKVALDPLIAGALQIVTPLLERRRQILKMTVPGDLPEIDVDPAQLTQVLVNLLTNAAKYSPDGSQIDLQVTQVGHMLRTIVADRGPGIPEPERRNLFQRFVRLDHQGGEQYGIGLGLHVVKTTIEAHGGQVGVDDRPGGGANFWFELPVGD